MTSQQEDEYIEFNIAGQPHTPEQREVSETDLIGLLRISVAARMGAASVGRKRSRASVAKKLKFDDDDG